MRDWAAFVRAQLPPTSLTPEREVRIVRELAVQVEDFYREALARGLSDADADAYARAQITDWKRMARDVERADSASRQARTERMANALDARGGRAGGLFQMFAHVIRDIRYGVRQLVRAPGFSLVAVLTLALGIGAASAIFSVINGVLLRPLPFAEPDRLVRVHEIVPQYGRFSVAPANVLDWRAQATAFERMAAYNSSSGTFAWADGPERVQGSAVSWDLFDLLHVSPAIGGTFNAAQDTPGNNNVILISNALWQRRFNSDAGVVGKSVTLSGTPVTILGVMPAGFYFPSRTAEFWRPLALNPANASRGAHFLGVVARRKPGITVERAGTEMKMIAERLATQYPDASAQESAQVVPLLEQMVGAIRPALVTLMAAVGVLVLIACANVANLLLVRASVRGREVAIRTALGAGRGRLIVQMLSESVVLAVVSGAIGLGLAYLSIPAIQTLSAGSIPRVADVSIDSTVIFFSLGASVLTGIIFGLVPALQLSSGGTALVMKDGGRSAVGSSGRWVRSGLLVAEVALSLMLLVGATLLLRSFARLTHVDPGFKADGVLAFQVSLPQSSYADAAKQLAFVDTLTGRLAASPGVRSVAAAQTLPLRGDYVLSTVIHGAPTPRPGDEPSSNYRAITPGYFDALRIPLKRGRAFSSQDLAKSAPVAIVDEAFVKRHYPDGNAIGKRIGIGNGTDNAEIVGIVGSVSYNGLESTQNPTMYMPMTQDPFGTFWVMVSANGDPGALAPTVRQTLAALDPALPAYSVTTLPTVLEESVAQRRFAMLLIVLFGGVAVFLSAVGLYGVVSYTVSLRTREIGLRMAIGAQPGDVMRMIVGGGMKVALIGVALGIAGAIAASTLVKSLLFQVEPSDPASYAITSALLLVIALLACYFPARRAMKVDPMKALAE